MSADQPLVQVGSEDAKTHDDSFFPDDIAKGHIAKQGLNITFEAPIMGVKADVVEGKIENNDKEDVNIENLELSSKAEDKPTIEAEPVVETLAAAAANIAIGFEANPSETNAGNNNEVEIEKHDKISENQASNAQETLHADSKSSKGM